MECLKLNGLEVVLENVLNSHLLAYFVDPLIADLSRVVIVVLFIRKFKKWHLSNLLVTIFI